MDFRRSCLPFARRKLPILQKDFVLQLTQFFIIYSCNDVANNREYQKLWWLQWRTRLAILTSFIPKLKVISSFSENASAKSGYRWVTPRKFSRVKYSKSQYVNARTSPFDLRIGTLRETSSPNKSPDPALKEKLFTEGLKGVSRDLEISGNDAVWENQLQWQYSRCSCKVHLGVYWLRMS